ncbi:MAG TPA: hypothetical protein VGW35_08530 [Methylomirabilota bacterium]|jgi:hypothetical protein|nr:hypothetical protein [Methylomirabilota bacterium]
MTSLFALALGTALVTAPSAPPAGVPSLAGTWTLNKEESEDARAKMRDSGAERPGGWTGPGGRGGMGGPGGGVGGRSGGFGGRGGGFGGRGANPDGGRDSGPRRAFLQPPETLRITQTAEEIGVDDGDRVLHLHPDGRKIKSEGGGAETTTRWRGNELVVETKADRGAKITSAYMLVPEKHQLYVTSTMEGRSGEPITVRRVYDAAPAESGQ